MDGSLSRGPVCPPLVQGQQNAKLPILHVAYLFTQTIFTTAYFIDTDSIVVIRSTTKSQPIRSRTRRVRFELIFNTKLGSPLKTGL
jgi:hypothetical protein